MRILQISDTHGRHRKLGRLAAADVIVHCGDFTDYGTEEEVLDKSSGIHWGNSSLLNRVLEVKPRYHLFGHAHEANGIRKEDGIIFSNGAVLDDFMNMRYEPRVIRIEDRKGEE